MTEYMYFYYDGWTTTVSYKKILTKKGVTKLSTTFGLDEVKKKINRCKLRLSR